ncbi:MAG: ABC transporter permease [Xanthobacteraceae bacterium]|nr:ABC transporter permease [Xanthobacteraceae bacterium]MBX3522099.1 ABC transporter permease [Xanthobacteraceae bacterium]MCW5673995.1 ABC transporter permease [Xanthobacteraceae bacterium]MCW5678193.1 ABC transporter permease [Xanthobacteraceae bacterium]
MRWLVPVLSILALLLLWEGVVRLLNIPIYMLPPPSKVAHVAVAESPLLFRHALSTIWAILLGFGLAVVIGIPIATLMIYSDAFNRAIYPILITAQVLPKVALAPLFIVWFGFGLIPKVLMTFLIAFFPIVVDTLAGLSAVRPESLMLLRSMGGSRWQSFWKVRLPTALPHIFSGLKIGMTFAVVGAIVAEFVASEAGLGYVLVEARASLNMVLVFAAIIWLIAIGFIFYFAVEYAERIFVKGRSTKRSQELGAGL